MVTGMEKPYVVGMDIGGTNTVFGIVDSRGNVLATDSVKTQSFSKIEDYVEAVSSKLRPLIESFGGVEKIKGMGVGAPNGNYYNGTIEFAPNLPWKGVIPLATLFEEAIGVPTALTNDANAAAIGEMTYGAARGMKDFIMITLGTGVGSGIVLKQCPNGGECAKRKEEDPFRKTSWFREFTRFLCQRGSSRRPSGAIACGCR